MNVLMIGAHPDDLDFRCSGLAKKYVDDGHNVRFLSCCNGCGGHHILKPDEIKARRAGELVEAAKVIGVQYDVWDVPDCEIQADLPTLKKMIRYIREFKPDIVFTHRNNDYHVDHRNTSLLVQDATYLLIVPNFCPEALAMREMPVVMHFEDGFQNPPFVPDVVMGIDDVVDDKLRMAHCHVSQVYEWLPFTEEYEDYVKMPQDEEGRFAWLRGDYVDADTPDEKILSGSMRGYGVRYAKTASRFRKELVERYGERGNRIVYAEAYAISEYGKQPTPEEKKVLFPY